MADEYFSDLPELWGIQPPPEAPGTDPVVENAVARAMEQTEPRHSDPFARAVVWGLAILLAIVLVIGVLGYHSLSNKSDQQTAQHKTDQAALLAEEKQRQQTESALTQAINQLQANGITPHISTTPVPGPAGAAGTNGANGRGILAVTRTANNHLVIVFTDGNTQDLGSFQGAVGATGRGIEATSISAGGDLVVAFTDGTAADVGHVVGAAGAVGPQGDKGDTGNTGSTGPAGANAPTITSVSISGCTVMTTLSDGSTATGTVSGLILAGCP